MEIQCFRSPNGQYFVVKDKYFYLLTLQNVSSHDVWGEASLGQHDGTIEGLPDDVGGHIQACSLGGTYHRFNLFPQNKQFNNSGYRIWENSLRKALQNGDRVGPVRVKFDRLEGQENSSRPKVVEVHYLINGRYHKNKWNNEVRK